MYVNVNVALNETQTKKRLFAQFDTSLHCLFRFSFFLSISAVICIEIPPFHAESNVKSTNILHSAYVNTCKYKFKCIFMCALCSLC